MQTLGASNPHNNNKDKHRGNTRYVQYSSWATTCDDKIRLFLIMNDKHYAPEIK